MGHFTLSSCCLVSWVEKRSFFFPSSKLLSDAQRPFQIQLIFGANSSQGHFHFSKFSWEWPSGNLFVGSFVDCARERGGKSSEKTGQKERSFTSSYVAILRADYLVRNQSEALWSSDQILNEWIWSSHLGPRPKIFRAGWEGLPEQDYTFCHYLSSGEKGLKIKAWTETRTLTGDLNTDLCDSGAVLHQLNYQANWELADK